MFTCGGLCHRFLGTLFSSENSLFIQIWEKKKLDHYLINVVNIKIRMCISSPRLHSAPLKRDKGKNRASIVSEATSD